MIKLRIGKIFTKNLRGIFIYMRVIVIIIYSKLAKNSLLFICFSLVKTKYKNQNQVSGHIAKYISTFYLKEREWRSNSEVGLIQ